MKKDSADVTPDPKAVAPADSAFLVSDIANAAQPITSTATWEQIGAAGEAIKKDLAAMNIDLSAQDLTVTIRTVRFDKNTAAFVDVVGDGGDAGPDPFRFVFVVSNGDYLGNAGLVES